MIGPVRPFIFGKLADAWRCSVRSWTLDSRVPAKSKVFLRTRKDVSVLPSADWRNAYGQQVRSYAERSAAGIIDAYGIRTWNVGDPLHEFEDLRGVLERSRMHHWCAYALMAHIEPSQCNDWKQRFVSEVRTFTDRYPAPDGIMWRVAMDVGIRVHSLLVAWDWFRQAGVEDAEFDVAVARFASDHAYVIDARLERAGGMSTSHYLGDLLGLVTVGAYIVDHEELHALASFAATELRNEIADQILDDGMDFEASTGYHAHVADILVRCTRMMLELPFEHDSIDDYWFQRLGSAIRAQQLLEHNGMPLIGDNDDGMAMKLIGFQPDTSAMFDEAKRFVPLKEALSVPLPESFAAFENFGLWFYRDKSAVMSVRCGAIGQYGKGGHAHNDFNAITLSVNNEQVIVDPGSAWYSGNAEQRNADRSIHSHATVCINNEEHAQFRLGGGEDLWWLLNEPYLDVDARKTTWRGVVGSGRQQHIRTIEFADVIRIQDDIAQNSRGIISIPLAPEIKVALHTGFAELTGQRSVTRISWTDCTGQLRRADIARAFGKSEETSCIDLTMHSNKALWTIEPIFAAHETQLSPR